jgi:hypothetical protein
MKKLVFIFALIVAGLTVDAQNIQAHYDMGKHRNYVTTTIEMFKPDKWGNTFFFVDFDYDSNGSKGMSLSYFEIARCLKFWKAPFSVHVEYNGGFGRAADFAFPLSEAWLAGVDYSWNSKDYSKGFSLKALYKRVRGNYSKSFQTTAVWYAHLWDKRITLSGFADFWREKTDYGKFIFLAEPQLWFNLTEKFSVGTEVELSQDFAGMKGFQVKPTAAVKWNF